MFSAERVARALREAVATMLAACATLACTLALAPEPGPAILAVVLCLSLARSRLDRSRRGRLEAALALPAVSLAALGVAMLLRLAPVVGAATFTGALTLSIWLRRFGEPGRQAGRLIALPFVVILVSPYAPPRHATMLPAWCLPLVVALLALFWVSVVDALAARLGGLPAPPQAEDAAPTERPTPPQAAAGPGASPRAEAAVRPPSTLRPTATTRLAAQMGVALALAFVVGHAVFDGRWAWVVLTAFIVGSGNQGRLDVVHKSVLRVLGAGAGTVVALGLGGVTLAASPGVGTAAILVALFLGVALRPFGYGWWAFFVTIALALLQGFGVEPAARLLALRMEEIVVGALLGIAAAWFVWPLRSSDVLRRRLADALAALAAAFDPATAGRTAAAFQARLADVEKLAPAFRAGRLVAPRRLGPAADWIDELAACRAPAEALVAREQAPGSVRRAIGAARKALREPPALGPALRELRQTLEAASSGPAA